MASDWRQRKKEELRQRLYDTALGLFETEGFERTTVQHITETVGVAKGTFFNHFPTKEHVVKAWYDRITFESLEDARKRDPTTAEEAIGRLFEDMANRAKQAPELLMAKARNSANPLLLEAEQTQDSEIDRYLLEVCAAGRLRGEFADDLDEKFLVDFLGDLLTGTSRAWVSSRPRFDFPTVIRQRVQFVFRAAKPA